MVHDGIVENLHVTFLHEFVPRKITSNGMNKTAEQFDVLNCKLLPAKSQFRTRIALVINFMDELILGSGIR